VKDSFGNHVKDSTSVTIGIGTNPPGNGTISGTLTKPTFNGVASFIDLKINTTSSGYTLHAIWDGHATVFGDSGAFAITNTNSSCGGQNQPACTATFPGGGPDGLPSSVSAPAGTTLIVETNQLQCSGVQNPIAGTVTIIPSGNGVVPVQFTDTIPLPVAGPYPFCKTPPAPAVGTVPLCSTVNGLNQDPIHGVVCVTESVEFTSSQTTAILHSVLYIDPTDPAGKH